VKKRILNLGPAEFCLPKKDVAAVVGIEDIIKDLT
jgi:hypothetical protein